MRQYTYCNNDFGLKEKDISLNTRSLGKRGTKSRSIDSNRVPFNFNFGERIGK